LPSPAFAGFDPLDQLSQFSANLDQLIFTRTLLGDKDQVVAAYEVRPFQPESFSEDAFDLIAYHGAAVGLGYR